MGLWVVVSIAAIGGVAVALQAQLAGLIDTRTGTAEAVFVTYGTGALAMGLVMLALRGGNLAEMRTLPWYVWLSGIMGLVIVGAVSYTAGRVGVVRALTIITASQFVFAAIIDHMGLLQAAVRPVDTARVLGIGMLLAGTWLVLR